MNENLADVFRAHAFLRLSSVTGKYQPARGPCSLVSTTSISLSPKSVLPGSGLTCGGIWQRSGYGLQQAWTDSEPVCSTLFHRHKISTEGSM